MTIQIVLTHTDPENKIPPSGFNTLPALLPFYIEISISKTYFEYHNIGFSVGSFICIKR